jgi:TolB-like protein/DNA-binding winged helix-turn-helix (wHTH) protein/Flp pilus assembly protein TadD
MPRCVINLRNSGATMDAVSLQRVRRFGLFEVDVRARELRKQGILVKLREQPFLILAALLERPGEVVTREELRRKLWPADTFVDFDNSVNAAVNRLREALGDSAENPRFIQTLPRHGYRFISPVETGDHDSPAAATPLVLPLPTREIPPLRKKIFFRNPGFWIACIAIGVALVSLGVYRWRARRVARAGTIQSIAVLPLENLTGDPGQEYFADGMTDALITDLAGIKALKVISRTSTMQYKGARKPLPQIARELNVDAVVEGTVVRSGERVRIDAQLIEAGTDRHLWARSYERDLRDIVALQGDVARAIANEIQIQVTPREQASLARTRPVDPEAYQAYLKGRYYLHQWTLEGFAKGIEYFQQAIAKDPSYAPAYAALSECYRLQVFTGPAPPAEGFPRAEAAARKALQLDDSLAEAHEAVAGIMWRFHYDWSAAESEFRRALELDPNSSLAHGEYSVFLHTYGRYEDAIPEARRSWELDPFSVWASHIVGGAYYDARQYDQAISQLRGTISLDPHRALSRFKLGAAYQHKGDLRQAIAELEKAVEFSRRGPLYVAALANAYAAAGRRADAEKLLAELVRRSAHEYVTPYDMAVVEVGLGRNREAMYWLQKAYADRSFPLPTIHSYPWFDPLRSLPEYQALERRIGLDPLQPVPKPQ